MIEQRIRGGEQHAGVSAVFRQRTAQSQCGANAGGRVVSGDGMARNGSEPVGEPIDERVSRLSKGIGAHRKWCMSVSGH